MKKWLFRKLRAEGTKQEIKKPTIKKGTPKIKLKREEK